MAAGLRASPAHDGRGARRPSHRPRRDGGGRRLGVTPREGLGPGERVDELPFEPGRGYHAVLGASRAGHLLSVKGAPEVVLTRCTHVLRERERIASRRIRAGGAGPGGRPARAPGIPGARGGRAVRLRRSDLDESRVAGLCFLGFLCLADPVRPTAAESVGRLMRAGVESS